ncbi:MAG: hypothetical protein M3460_30285 [Actinomycetota bacterium]|nr:hypothetical protein [Actinomycetota bacterium]
MNPPAPDPVPAELEDLVRLATRALNEHTNDAFGADLPHTHTSGLGGAP